MLGIVLTEVFTFVGVYLADLVRLPGATVGYVAVGLATYIAGRALGLHGRGKWVLAFGAVLVLTAAINIAFLLAVSSGDLSTT